MLPQHKPNSGRWSGAAVEAAWRRGSTSGHSEILQALPAQSPNPKDNDTTSQKTAKGQCIPPSMFFTAAPSPYPPSFLESDIVRAGGCLKGHQSSCLTPSLLLESPTHLNKWLFIFPESENSLAAKEGPGTFGHFSVLSLQWTRSFPFPLHPVIQGLVSGTHGIVWCPSPQTALEMSEAYDCISLGSPIPQTKIPKSCLIYLFIHSLIHSTYIPGASAASGPGGTCRVWNMTRHSLHPLARDLLFPNANASPSVDAA